MKNILVSIIVPVYKVEPYLYRCLDSIVNQTYTNLEIILVDDGSPDKCPCICDEYAAKDNRITVVHKKNGGLSDARNAGLDICKGEYISFVDSDDWISEKYIDTLLNLATRENADIAIVNHKHVTNFSVIENKKESSIKCFSKEQALFRLIAEQHQPFVVSWGKLYRKRLFNCIRFPVGKSHEDEFVAHLLINESVNIVYSDEIMYFYNQRPGSITKGNHTIDKIDAFERRLTFVIDNNFNKVIPYAASNLCWKYLNLCYEKYSKKEDFQQILSESKEKQSFMRLRKVTDLFLVIFLRFPKFYFLVKNVKC